MPIQPTRRRGVVLDATPNDLLGDGVPFSHKKDSGLAEQLAASHTLPALLATLGIEAWDYLVIGDGSATRWDHEAGWASILYWREGDRRQRFHGGFSAGTNIVAELMAVVHPLLYLANTEERIVLKRLHVLTDCEYLTQAGPERSRRKKNRELWAVVDAVRQRGLRIHWHWIPRDTLVTNQYAHDMANLARKQMKALNEKDAAEVASKLLANAGEAPGEPQSDSDVSEASPERLLPPRDA